MLDLATLGWDDGWNAAFEPYRTDGLVPGRVAVQHRGEYDVLTHEGERRAKITTRLRRESDRTAMPVVGDWVALDCAASIVDVVPRRTTISRRAAHEPASGVSREQIIAANVDLVLVVQALGQELDRRLLERYLALALESGARPAVVLTKADLENDPAAVAAEIANIGGAVPDLSGVGSKRARSRCHPRRVRPRHDRGASRAVRRREVHPRQCPDRRRIAARNGRGRPDGAGRHTTTRRELVLLPSGGVIVDNPGMREVHLWIGDRDLTDAFDDIAELALACRFTDCSHETEPDAPFARRSPRARSPGRGGRATRHSSASSPSWPSDSSDASALGAGGGRPQRPRQREG